MYSVTPECKGGNNSKCDLQWRSLNGISIDMPETPVPDEVELPAGFGEFDMGDVTCKTCNNSWTYTILFGELKFIERFKPDQMQAEENGHTHGDDCGCGV